MSLSATPTPTGSTTSAATCDHLPCRSQAAPNNASPQPSQQTPSSCRKNREARRPPRGLSPWFFGTAAAGFQPEILPRIQGFRFNTQNRRHNSGQSSATPVASACFPSWGKQSILSPEARDKSCGCHPAAPHSSASPAASAVKMPQRQSGPARDGWL